MKIFSNFDTNFQEEVFKKTQDNFPLNEIILIKRSIYYFFIRVLLSVFVLLALLSIISLGLYKHYFLGFICGHNMYKYIILVPIILVWITVFWFTVGRRFLKYKYDFTIVSPQGILTYKQKGILHNVIKEIPGNRIRSIEISRNKSLENIFGYGKLDILTDFSDNMRIGEDDEAASVIGLTYVDNPYEIKNQITDLCFK